MSSGACRALVAVLLTLTAVIVMALPVTAKDERLLETSNVIYTLRPSQGAVDVQAVITLQPRAQRWQGQAWRQLVVEEDTAPQASRGYRVAGSASDLPGLWQAVNVRTPAIAAGERGRFEVSYTLDAGVTEDSRKRQRTPARLDPSYMYFCVSGQDTDQGTVQVRIPSPGSWDLTQHGTAMESTGSGFKSSDGDLRSPGAIFTCFEGVREDRLEKRTFIGPADRVIELQAWEDLDNWLDAAENTAPAVLRDLHEFIGYDIPGEGPVVVRMAPSPIIGGHASAHSTPGVVQLDEFGGIGAEHQLAHAWFTTDNFQDRWLREGMAEWVAASMAGETCAPVDANELELDLSDDGWLVIAPQSPEGIEELVDTQLATACGIVSAVAARMPEEQWHEVVGSMLRGETKYIGSAGPELGTATRVGWQEWLDAIDERGLVPAAADPKYAANLDDLDFAQDLLDSFGIPVDIPGFGSELGLRSEARARYHRFLTDIAPFGAPHAVRKDMDDWRFSDAIDRIELSTQVFQTLTEADASLPTADLLSIMQPKFEAAKNDAELDEVVGLSQILLEGTQNVVGPLSDLNEIMPEGWNYPVAVSSAITELRFGDILAAITPAGQVARDIVAAHEALPQARLLETYRASFEASSTPGELDRLASDAASERRNAERAGRELAGLLDLAGDWDIPTAVTTPLEQGQLQAGIRIIGDATKVIEAANAGDEILPAAGLRDEIRPLFEQVENEAGMASLREQAEQRAEEARVVGEALDTFERLVPGWRIPAVVADPVADGDFTTASQAAAAARAWIEAAFAAQADLPQLDAMNRIKAQFENARTLAQLQAGADLAQDWAEAASWVQRAIAESRNERDLLTEFGLWGVDVDGIVRDAIRAATDGDVQLAINKSSEAIGALQGGFSAGSLRLAGLIFFMVAVLGVLGLWVMLRRQAGPSWARSSTPHWVDDSGRRNLFRRRKDGEGKPKKDDKRKQRPPDRRQLPPGAQRGRR